MMFFCLFSATILLLVLCMVRCKVVVQERDTAMLGCDGRRGWWRCGEGEECISPAQMCDGKPDCDQGRDEHPNTCASWPCTHGVRCQQSDVCIDIPHQVMCQGEGGRSVCPDGSDQSFCLHRIYTGCFINTTLGLTIADCDTCFCQLRDKVDTKHRTAAVFRSIGSSFRSSHVMARVCVERSSSLICDGVEDCMFGEDEDSEMCENKEENPESFLNTKLDSQRKGRKVDLDQFDIENVADLETADISEITINIKMISMIFLGTFISVVGVCLAIIFVMFRLSSKIHKKDSQTRTNPHIEHQSSSGGANTYILDPKSSSVVSSPKWTLKTINIIKELGKGFYSKVYLTQDRKNGYVAIKTVDSKRSSKAEECISNEIEILSNIGTHCNIIKLIGFNVDEKLLVIEYCFHGNLKDYVLRYKEYFTNEINPETQELIIDPVLCASPTLSQHIPMTDYLMAIHAKMDTSSEELQDEKNSKSLLKTRRLLNWSYQASVGLKYLAEQGIIHRDVALRNILLTSNDVIKIADFGLAVSAFSPTQARQSGNKETTTTPQYWSRSNKPTPFKWVALESLTCGVFSTESDVWAFGVMMWELFTLGEEPYGDINPLELTKMLQAGRRLGDCVLAPYKVNQLLKHCWTKDPSQRPTFEDLKKDLSQYFTSETIPRYNSRIRIDSGVSGCEGYLDMNSTRVSTPAASQSSIGSRSASKYLIPNPVPSSDYTQDSLHMPRASYWTNYKIINGAPLQVEKYPSL